MLSRRPWRPRRRRWNRFQSSLHAAAWVPRRRLAAAGDNPTCPRAALFIVPALPNVRDAATFQVVRATYVNVVKRLAPTGAFRLQALAAGAARGKPCAAACVPSGAPIPLWAHMGPRGPPCPSATSLAGR